MTREEEIEAAKTFNIALIMYTSGFVFYCALIGSVIWVSKGLQEKLVDGIRLVQLTPRMLVPYVKMPYSIYRIAKLNIPKASGREMLTIMWYGYTRVTSIMIRALVAQLSQEGELDLAIR